MEPFLIIIAVIAVIGLGFVLYYRGLLAPEVFLGLFDCCLAIVVYGVTIAVTLGAFLLWHSLLVAALVGEGVMLMILLVLSVAVASNRSESKASYRPHSYEL